MHLSDQWTLATGEEDGKRQIYRIRLAAPAFATKSCFSQFLLILWEYQSDTVEGLPNENDLERMTKLEDLLRVALEDAHQGFLSVVITGTGLREWQWYVRDSKTTMELVNKTLGGLEPFPVHFDFRKQDSDWGVYRRFLDITASGKRSP